MLCRRSARKRGSFDLWHAPREKGVGVVVLGLIKEESPISESLTHLDPSRITWANWLVAEPVWWVMGDDGLVVWEGSVGTTNDLRVRWTCLEL
jgi:hypothetical protein